MNRHSAYTTTPKDNTSCIRCNLSTIAELWGTEDRATVTPWQPLSKLRQKTSEINGSNIRCAKADEVEGYTRSHAGQVQPTLSYCTQDHITVHVFDVIFRSATRPMGRTLRAVTTALFQNYVQEQVRSIVVKYTAYRYPRLSYCTQGYSAVFVFDAIFRPPSRLMGHGTLRTVTTLFPFKTTTNDMGVQQKQ